MTTLPPIQRFATSSGARLYRVSAEAFPDFIVHAFVLLGAGVPTLIDTGSGLGDSTDHLLAGIAALHDHGGEAIGLPDIERILITHGHIDHFGGLGALQAATGARVGIHPLDRRVLTGYEERVAVASNDMRTFIERAGVPADEQAALLDIYSFAKKEFRSVAVDFALEDGGELDGMRFIHVPGHCPGQVCILIGDVLLSADHILSHTTPHQAPESITHYTGLGHYLESLTKIARVPGIRLTLGSHEEPIGDVYARIELVRASHMRKLARIEDAITRAARPLTVYEITDVLYPGRAGYDVLLAVEEVGAHVEYLYEHARLRVDNWQALEHEDNPALRYAVV